MPLSSTVLGKQMTKAQPWCHAESLGRNFPQQHGLPALCLREVFTTQGALPVRVPWKLVSEHTCEQAPLNFLNVRRKDHM